MIRGGRFNDPGRHQLVNERVRFDSHDVEWNQDCRREVGDVEGHDDVGHTGEGGGQDMAVVRIGQREPLFPTFVTVHPAAPNVLVHELASPQERGTQIGPSV